MKGFYRCLRAGCLCFGLIVFMNLQAGALSPAEDVDWTQPQTVDPLQPGIAIFWTSMRRPLSREAGGNIKAGICWKLPVIT